MAGKKKYSKKKSSKATISGVFCLVVAVIALLIQNLFGIDILGILEDTGAQIQGEQQAGGNSSDQNSGNVVVQSGNMTVHFLDIGQGLCVFVQSEGENLIYDGGDKKTADDVVAYLENLGVETIDYMISSHYDSDHVSGLIDCLENFDVEYVICSDYVHGSKTYENFLAAVEAEGLTPNHPAVGESFTFGNGGFTILAPNTIDEDDSNANSVAIKLINGNNSFIITGDAEIKNEKEMCQTGIDLACDVLVPGHHGSATATSWDFLEATLPAYAVISCGTDNSYGHPHEETMEKLESANVEVFRTDIQGTITVTSDGKNLTWSQEPCNDYTSGD